MPMTLKNTSPSESVCFKVTTTAPRQYCVRPNKGIIHPQATESVQGKPFELPRHKINIVAYSPSKESGQSGLFDLINLCFVCIEND